jgi:site-specific recombinase XerD
MEFRHNCATTLLRKGVDIYTVKEILGHSNISTTARYLAVVDEIKRAALDKLSTF